MSEHVDEFVSNWTTAECKGDAETLGTLLTNDFCGVGPLGFVLPRLAWLDRHQQGLNYEEFSLEEIEIRRYGDVSVVTARNKARGTYLDRPIPEASRVTLVVVPDPETLRLATIHMSFIAGTQGSPPMPGPPAAKSDASSQEGR